MNVADQTYYRDAKGELTTDESQGHFLVVRKGAEITPDILADHPDLKGVKPEKSAAGGDSTLSEAEAAAVEANRADAYARRQREMAHGEDAGDPEKLREEARKAAMREQSALAESIGKAGLGEDEDAVTGPKGKKAAKPSENK